MRKSQNTGRNNGRADLLPVGIVLAVLVFWQLIVSWGDIPPYILPSPIMVLKALFDEKELLLTHTLATLNEALVGFSLAVVLGMIFGILMGYSEPFRRALYPIFIITQTIPIIVLAPLFAIWFGFGFLPKILIVILVCFFPVAVTFAQGLIKADEDMDQLLKVMGAKRWQAFRKVRIPQALPSLFSGLKIAATYSIMGAVISEWVGAKSGLGIFMTRAMSSFRTSVLFADVFVIIVLSLGIYKAVEIIEKKIILRKYNIR